MFIAGAVEMHKASRTKHVILRPLTIRTGCRCTRQLRLFGKHMGHPSERHSGKLRNRGERRRFGPINRNCRACSRAKASRGDACPLLMFEDRASSKINGFALCGLSLVCRIDLNWLCSSSVPQPAQTPICADQPFASARMLEIRETGEDSHRPQIASPPLAASLPPNAMRQTVPTPL